MNKKITEGVEKYYTEKIEKFGNTSLGVDWNSKESQFIRFEQLIKVINKKHSNFSLLDYGCGTGELNKFLKLHKCDDYEYIGFDLSEKMIKIAKEYNNNENNVYFDTMIQERIYDYAIASGIFNVKLDLANNEEWNQYIINTLHELNKKTTMGFSFNALTMYSDFEHMKDYLYYANPLELFDYCKINFSRNVALLHDYNLFEFTIIVRK